MNLSAFFTSPEFVYLILGWGGIWAFITIIPLLLDAGKTQVIRHVRGMIPFGALGFLAGWITWSIVPNPAGYAFGQAYGWMLWLAIMGIYRMWRGGTGPIKPLNKDRSLWNPTNRQIKQVIKKWSKP